MRFRQAVYPQLYIFSAIFLGLIAVAVWQREFVIAGTMSNVYLNGAIFVGITFGVALHFYNLWALKNEFAALDALNEAYDDSRLRVANGGLPAEVADLRMRAPGRVFSPPDYLGSSFRLLYPPLIRHQTLKIPSATAKQMVEDVDSRIMSTVAFGNYVAGLMVLLGLLGTFIGLLATVGSVGEILASLDFTSGAGVEQIQDLMASLEAPLGGMATGFSSSLFGLIGSLMLGMMAKVADRSYKALRTDFEDWINRVAQVEQIARDDGFNEADVFEASRRDDGSLSGTKLLMNIAKTIVQSSERVGQSLDNQQTGLRALADDAAAQRMSLNSIATTSSELARTAKLFAERAQDEAARREAEAKERDAQILDAVVAVQAAVREVAVTLAAQTDSLDAQTALLTQSVGALDALPPLGERNAAASEAVRDAAVDMAGILTAQSTLLGKSVDALDALPPLGVRNAAANEGVRDAAEAIANALVEEAARASLRDATQLDVAAQVRDASAALTESLRAQEALRSSRPTDAGAPGPHGQMVSADGFLDHGFASAIVRGAASTSARVSRTAAPELRGMRRRLFGADIDPTGRTAADANDEGPNG